MPILAVGAIAGAVSALGSLFGGIFGGSAKRQAAYAGAALTDKQAEFTRMQTTEQVRRFDIEREQRVGQATAAAGASGFAEGGSMTKYVNALSAELGLEQAWMRRAGYQTAAFQEEAADVQRQSADAGLFGDVLGGVSGFLGGASNTAMSLYGMGRR